VRIATQQGTAQTRRGSTYVDFWKKLWIARRDKIEIARAGSKQLANAGA